jgi:hypothetical protein
VKNINIFDNEFIKKNFSSTTFKVIFNICLIILITSIVFVFFVKIFIIKTDNYLSYSETSSADYKVNLKKNDYYEVDKLPSGMNYIASLIDTIDVNFDYLFESSKVVDYDSTYYIEAITRVYGDREKSSILFEKKEILKEETKISKQDIVTNSFKESVTVDYDHFNKFVNDFKSDYALSTGSDVTIILHVNSEGTNKEYEGKIKLDSKASIVIPLSEQTINIKINKNDINTHDVLLEKLGLKNVNILQLTILIVFTIIDIYLIYKVLSKLLKYLGNITEYEKKRNKILKEYDSIIVNTGSDVDISKYQIVDVLGFNELVDVHDNLGNPILYYEIIPNRICCFSIVKDRILYRYTLNSEKMKD